MIIPRVQRDINDCKGGFRYIKSEKIMCDKLPYNNPRIDKCLVGTVKEINRAMKYKTLASCCGHNKYPKTIVVKDRLTGDILEYFSKTPLQVKKRNRYYKKDEMGFYFIPELKNKGMMKK